MAFRVAIKYDGEKFGPIPPPTRESRWTRRLQVGPLRLSPRQRALAIEMERIAFAHLDINKALFDEARCDCETLMDALTHLQYFDPGMHEYKRDEFGYKIER